MEQFVTIVALALLTIVATVFSKDLRRLCIGVYIRIIHRDNYRELKSIRRDLEKCYKARDWYTSLLRSYKLDLYFEHTAGYRIRKNGEALTIGQRGRETGLDKFLQKLYFEFQNQCKIIEQLRRREQQIQEQLQNEIVKRLNT